MLKKRRPKGRVKAKAKAKQKSAVVVKEIARLKQMEEELLSCETRYRTLLESLSQKIFYKDKNSVYVSCNKNYARDLKIRPDEIVGRTDYEFYPRELAEKYRADDRTVIETGKLKDVEEKYIQDRKEVFVHTVKTPVKDHQGNVVGVLGIFWDITERKRAEEKYRILFESSRDAIMMLEPPTWNFTAGNKATVEMFRAKDENEFTSKKPYELSPDRQPDGQPSKDKAIKMINLAMKKGSNFFDWQHKRIDGEEFPATVLLTRMELSGKNILQATVRDITERKRAEEKLRSAYETLRSTQAQLIQTEKIAGIGKLGAGVAHELNSPLTGLINLIESYLERTKEGTKDHKDFAVMLDAARHMARIVRDLGAFSRESKGEKTEVSVNEMIDSTLSFSAQQLSIRDIRLIKDYADDLPRVAGESGQLQQVVLNVISNAHDVMPSGGEFIVRTRASESRDNVIMEFVDNGPGIKQEDLSRIFDPFFTTKGPGKGVGLGLSVSYAIVENHGGRISVESQLGKGTKFTIVLPSAKRKKAKVRNR